MNTATLQDTASAALTAAQPLAEGPGVDYREVFATYYGWMPMLPGYGVRLVGADEPMRASDFDLAEMGEQGPEAIYNVLNDVGLTRESRRSAATKKMHHRLRYRYTTHVVDGIFSDAQEAEVVAAYQAQVAELARLEREALGKAVATYRAALDAGAQGDEVLTPLRIAASQALGNFKFETRGGWWNQKTATWGIGSLDEDGETEMEAGAIVSGPHS